MALLGIKNLGWLASLLGRKSDEGPGRERNTNDSEASSSGAAGGRSAKSADVSRVHRQWPAKRSMDFPATSEAFIQMSKNYEADYTQPGLSVFWFAAKGVRHFAADPAACAAACELLTRARLQRHESDTGSVDAADGTDISGAVNAVLYVLKALSYILFILLLILEIVLFTIFFIPALRHPLFSFLHSHA